MHHFDARYMLIQASLTQLRREHRLKYVQITDTSVKKV
jgi:hypothetical protein